MDTKVKLSEILEAMEFLNDEVRYYLDKATGRVHLVTSDIEADARLGNSLEDYAEWEREPIEVIRRLEADDESLIGLPTQWDIHEYEIMADFCDSLEAGTVQEALFIALRGSGAFRRFKDAIHTFDVADDWYKYRDARFKAIAIEWCEDQGLAYVDDTEKRPRPDTEHEGAEEA